MTTNHDKALEPFCTLKELLHVMSVFTFSFDFWCCVLKNWNGTCKHDHLFSWNPFLKFDANANTNVTCKQSFSVSFGVSANNTFDIFSRFHASMWTTHGETAFNNLVKANEKVYIENWIRLKSDKLTFIPGGAKAASDSCLRGVEMSKKSSATWTIDHMFKA